MFRIAIGPCTCASPQPDALRQAVCREMMRQLDELKTRPASELKQLPPYGEVNAVIGGRRVKFETIVEPGVEAEFMVVKRAFIRSWSRPNWISLWSVGQMFADGFVVRANGSTGAAPDRMMWEFR